MSNVHRVEREIGGRTLSIETGRIARQADGAVIVQYAETMVLVTAVTAPPRFDDIDFFPLSVDYREKHSAAGKFPGGFIKREGRPSTKEILSARAIDRPIRPLFPEGYVQEVQIMCNVLSADQENDPDILAMIGASAALSISKIPFQGPLGACRVAKVDGELVVNPTHEQLDEGELNLLLAGRKNAMNMIEVDADQQPEDVVADAIGFAQQTVNEICEMIDELTQQCGVEKEIILQESDDELLAEIQNKIADELYNIKVGDGDKGAKKQATKELFEKTIEEYCSEELEEPRNEGLVKRILGSVEEVVVKKILNEGKRTDGRAFDQLRDISCEVDIFPRTHGSAMFTRGETQSLVSVTLGTVRDAQIIDGLLEEYTQNFTLHYNFPPYSVGEVRPARGPGRREIGHGALAEKALERVKPNEDDFAYTVRIVSDITESNGSSSMASVCGGCLALMDAGVPIKNPVAGISIGMITDENGKYRLITDIAGEEDHYGEMDFKVAGSEKGITAIQLDIKTDLLSFDIMKETLQQAREARLKILETMKKCIAEPKQQLSKYAPKLISVQIDPEFIGKLIGPGGKSIKKLQEDTGTTIEIEEDGTVFISCTGGDGHLEAKEIIEAMTTPPEVGKLYAKSRVVSIKDFGAFVEIVPGVEGLCHISELSDGYVKNAEDICKVGDEIPVKLIAIDDQGRMKLSRKAAMVDLGQTDRKEGDEKREKRDRKPRRKE